MASFPWALSLAISGHGEILMEHYEEALLPLHHHTGIMLSGNERRSIAVQSEVLPRNGDATIYTANEQGFHGSQYVRD